MGAHVRSPITKRKGSCRKKTFAMDPDEKAARALSHESAVARKACMPVGEDVIGNLDGAQQISEIPRERLAPDAIDNVFQDMAKFTYFKPADQDMDA